MTTCHRIALIVAAASFAACSAPSEDGGPESDVAASFTTDMSVDADAILDAPGLVTYGEVTTVAGAEVPNAQVCHRASGICSMTRPDGSFDFAGLEEGISEVLEVNAAGFFPVIVPIMYSAEAWVGVQLVPVTDGTVPDGRGAVRFVDWSDQGEAQEPAMGPSIELDGRPIDTQVGERAAGSKYPSLAAGQYDVSFAPVDAGMICVIETGWSGPEFNTATLPIVAGAITQVSRSCSPR